LNGRIFFAARTTSGGWQRASLLYNIRSGARRVRFGGGSMATGILVERDGKIARVTLNQPAKLNAVNNAMWQRLGEVFGELDTDLTLRCVVLTGAGEKAFSVGADISEFEANRSTVEKARLYARRTHAAMTRITACRHPVVARIRGLCVGGGLELALTADLRIAGESARFGIPVKRLGLVVAYPELEPLVQLVGPANALEILLEGRIFGADDALRMGLINRVVPDAELDAELEASLARIVEGAPLVARWHKKFTRRLLQPAPLSADELDESFHCFGTEDFQAGYRAFLAKAKPEFEGR
jgi:enoyl-CoA hydratase/carnithine racemase